MTSRFTLKLCRFTQAHNVQIYAEIHQKVRNERIFRHSSRPVTVPGREVSTTSGQEIVMILCVYFYAFYSQSHAITPTDNHNPPYPPTKILNISSKCNETMGCAGSRPLCVAPGELILVPRNSSERCIFEHIQALQYDSSAPVPLTLRSHPQMAITSLSNSNRTPLGNAGSYLDVSLGIGPQTDALYVNTIRTVPGFHFRSVGGCFILNSNDQKLFDCGHNFDERTNVTRGCCWNDSIRFRVEGREFLINSDGTISPAGQRGGNLVLGINEGWKQETITPRKVELLRMIESASPLYILSETGVNKNGQRTITGLNFIHEPIGERGFQLSTNTSDSPPRR